MEELGKRDLAIAVYGHSGASYMRNFDIHAENRRLLAFHCAWPWRVLLAALQYVQVYQSYMIMHTRDAHWDSELGTEKLHDASSMW